jgi:hypothetical protein
MNIKSKDVYESLILDDFMPVRKNPDYHFETRCLDMFQEPAPDESDPSITTMSLVPTKYHHLIRKNDRHINLDNFEENYLKKHEIDSDRFMESILINEAKQSIQKECMNGMYEQALENKPLYRSRWQKVIAWIYLKLFKKTYRPIIKSNEAKRIIPILLAEANAIMREGKRGPASFVIVNSKTASILIDSSFFVFTDPTNPSIGHPLLHKIGTIAGLTIYVDPTQKWKDRRILIGRKVDIDQPGLGLFYKEDEYLDIEKTRNLVDSNKVSYRLGLSYLVAPYGKDCNLNFRTITIEDE